MDPSRLTILIVDDSPTQLSVLQDTLEAKGYRVETAKDGMEAITKVSHAPPALILSDVMMPELNGYHLCRLLKNDPRTVHIPVILLTNLKERHDRFWGEKAGADLYLEKESDLTPIIGAVESLLSTAATPEVRPQHPLSELTKGDVRSRITGILDRLLYESTISNEVLKLTGLAHDIDQLARELLHFLSVISRYSIACLLLREGRDKHILGIQCSEGMSTEAIEQAKLQTLCAVDLNPEHHGHVRVLLVRDEEDKDPPAERGELHPLLRLPIEDQGEKLAVLALFSTRQERLTEGTLNALNVVADRLLIVTRYLKKYQEIEEVKGDFVSMLVHDMRSPLTSIRGFTDVLAEGILGNVNEEQASALQNIQGGCDRLLTLIEDVLDLSKLEAGKMQIHAAPLSIRALAERTCDDLAALAMKKSLSVRLEFPEDDPWVLGDGKQLSRVLTNLLTNAVKFTPPWGEIVISAKPVTPRDARKPEDGLQISVTDSGPGIPTDQQQKLFSRYQQLSTARTFRKGTGLGLAICKEIVLLHDGEIWVESPLGPDGGSRFSFTLPLA